MNDPQGEEIDKYVVVVVVLDCLVELLCSLHEARTNRRGGGGNLERRRQFVS